MEPVNFWRTAQYSNQLSHLAEANVFETLKKKNNQIEVRKGERTEQTNKQTVGTNQTQIVKPNADLNPTISTVTSVLTD